MSCELQQNSRHTTRLERFRPVLSTLPSTKIAAETCHENRSSTQHPETQTPMARPHPTPQKHHSPNANPNGTAQKIADLTKRCACAVNSTSILQHLAFAHVPTLFHTNLTRHVFIRNALQKLSPMAAALAPYSGRRRTVADAETTRREQGSTPSPTELKENPSLRIWGLIDKGMNKARTKKHTTRLKRRLKNCDGHSEGAAHSRTKSRGAHYSTT